MVLCYMKGIACVNCCMHVWNASIKCTHFTLDMVDIIIICYFCCFIIEFVEDNSLKAFSFQKPYHKRVAAVKMNSGMCCVS